MRGLYHELFRYDDGKLYWRELRQRGFSKSGKEAGTPNKDYLWVKSNKLPARCKSVHLIIWEMFNGPVPDGHVIDHINRDTFDNRIENLRLATRSQNSLNASGKQSRRLDLPKNVYVDWCENGITKYRAQMVIDGVTHREGNMTLDEAIVAADRMRSARAGEFACAVNAREIA